MNLYSIDVRICGRAYIKAGTEEEALAIARNVKADSLHLIEDLEAEIPITGCGFNDERLPDVSLSLVLTVHGPDANAQPALVQEDI